MEKVDLDRKSFYDFLETLFNRIDPVNRVAFSIKNKKGYRKIDGDYCKCLIEEYSLVYPDGKKILEHDLISKTLKLSDSTIILDQKEFDTSAITIEEIREIFCRDYKSIPMLHRMPDIIQSIKIDENINESGLLVINSDLKDNLCDNIINYLNEEEIAFNELQTGLYYKEEDEDKYKSLNSCNKIRSRKLC
ncbi:MAG: hypothetical protein ACI31R_01115 [Bacilli bacterium]